MDFSSSSRNINRLTVSVAILTVIGLFNPSMFSLFNIMLSVVSFYVLSIFGIYLMMHRYFSHKSFQFKNKFLKLIMTVISLAALRGSPFGWVYIHRMHHAYSDTNLDPHSPKILGYKLFGFGHYKKHESEKLNLFLVKDLMSKEHLFIHKWYSLIIIVAAFLISVVNLEVLYFGWILPGFLVHISQNSFNYFGHLYGYKNFVSRDDSRNNKWLFPFILGEAWHNNHHVNAKNYTTRVKSFELDPLGKFIELIKK